LYAAHAAATASAALATSFTGTSKRTMNDPPSGASRIVAFPRTSSDHPAGATNVLPVMVVLGVSTAMRSGAPLAGATNSVKTTAKIRESFETVVFMNTLPR
jgi:hypothetical protein